MTVSQLSSNSQPPVNRAGKTACLLHVLVVSIHASTFTPLAGPQVNWQTKRGILLEDVESAFVFILYLASDR